MKFKLPLLIMILLTYYSCTNKGKSKVTANSGFLDSVASQSDLSFAQVKKHTSIDTIYYQKNSTFAGDTVYYRDSAHPLVVLLHDDHLVCLKKLLLVFGDGEKCTDNLLIETDCDIDYSTDSSELSYKILSDTSFITTETLTERNEGQKDKITVTEQFYKISDKGKIIALNKKSHQFTRDRNPEDE